jgi:putative DNA primase/helicase
MANPITILPEQFLLALFDPNDKVCIRIFDDRKGSTFKGLKLECDVGKFPQLTETLQKHNSENRGIFFVVNTGGNNDNEITRINAQFVESDEGTFEEQWARIEAFPIQPSLVVKTRKSLHCYWLVKNAEVGKFRRIQKQLVAQFNGDPNCVNESRVLRIPGFYHCKREPVMVEVVEFHPERRYTQFELSETLPKIAEENEQSSPHYNTSGTRKGMAQVGKRCDFMQYCKANAAALPEGLWYAMISNLAVFENGDKAIHALSKPYPNYDYGETQRKIAHFIESGTKPMTCAKIVECGFKCPKFERGGCDCKSPAALAFKPLAVADILEILNKLEICATSLENIQVLKEFALDYLYNIDSVTAETILNHNAKEHFKLKASDISPLIKLHRDTYKKYTENKETRRETSGGELPEWYEPTEKGGLRFLPFLLADHMAKTEKVFYGAGGYFFYERGVYVMQEDLAAFAAIRQKMMRTAKSAEISDAEKQWRSAIRKAVREINANPFIANVRNGLYNVLDGSFKPHTPDYYSTVQINANYDPTAECPQFLAFLADTLPETELSLIQEIFGYLLIPVNKAQKSFVFVGAPNAGKSTLLSIAQEVLLGSENVSNIPWQALGERFNKAELFGKLANIFADLPSKSIDDGGMFKALTGEDYLTAERKNKDPFNFRPYARLLFSCNDIPKNYSDRSDGFYRRLLIIRFDKSVPQERRDPNLREKVAAERDGILAWALDGLRRLIANSYVFSETERTRDELTKYKTECNSVLMFVSETCKVKVDAMSMRGDVYEKYKDYCHRNNYKPVTQANFNNEVMKAYPFVTKGQEKVSGRHVWRGMAYSGDND